MAFLRSLHGHDRMPQGGENRGSLISVPVALRVDKHASNINNYVRRHVV